MPSPRIIPVLVLLAAAGACSKPNNRDCIGTPEAAGEWAVFAGALGDGQACTTPAGDLHVRYESVSSDRLVEMWSTAIPEKLDVKLDEDWAASGAYRHATYAHASEPRTLIVQIVQSGSTPVRTG